MDFSVFLVGWLFEFLGIYFLFTQSTKISSWMLKNWVSSKEEDTIKEIERLKKSSRIWEAIGFGLLGYGLGLQFLYVSWNTNPWFQ